MNPDNTSLNIQRVGNGWIVTGMPFDMRREGGFLPNQTLVACTAQQLAEIVGEWAIQQGQTK